MADYIMGTMLGVSLAGLLVLLLFPSGRRSFANIFSAAFGWMRRKHNAPLPDPRQMLREMRAREMQDWDNEFRSLMGLGPLRRDIPSYGPMKIVAGVINSDKITVTEHWRGLPGRVWRVPEQSSSVVLPDNEVYPEVVEMELASPEDRAETQAYIDQYTVTKEERQEAREEIKQLQQQARAGGYMGPIDGIPGPQMVAALNRMGYRRR